MKVGEKLAVSQFEVPPLCQLLATGWCGEADQAEAVGRGCLQSLHQGQDPSARC